MAVPSCTSVETSDPRVLRTRATVLGVAADLLEEGGWDAVSHSTVAARAGVGRTTIYRHWPDKVSLLGDAISARIDADLPAPTGDLRTDLIANLEQFRAALDSQTKRGLMCTVLAEAERSPQFKALRRQVTATATSGVAAALREGIKNGALRSDLDRELAIEQLVGPMMFRGLMWHRPVTRAMLVSLVDALIESNAPKCS